MNKIIGNQVFRQLDTEFYTADVPESDLFKQESPSFRWKGSPMPISTVHQILAFFRWCYNEYKGEAMVRLAYHPTDGWKAVPMLQEGRAGMSVTDSLDTEVVKNLHEAGAQLFGSAHSHCTAGAFASGTDDKDERESPGLHFTLGKILDNQVDIHVRATMRGIRYEVDILDWFSCPQLDQLRAVGGLPNAILRDSLKYFLTNPNPATLEFPEEWKTRIVKPRFPAHSDRDWKPQIWSQPSSHNREWDPEKKVWTPTSPVQLPATSPMTTLTVLPPTGLPSGKDAVAQKVSSSGQIWGIVAEFINELAFMSRHLDECGVAYGVALTKVYDAEARALEARFIKHCEGEDGCKQKLSPLEMIPFWEELLEQSDPTSLIWSGSK